MIIDSHVHTFPFMGGASGHRSAEEHLRRLQRGCYSSINAPYWKRDLSPVKERTLWDGKDPSPAGMANVGFKAVRYGRFEWTTDKGDIALQYFAPSLIDNICTAEYMVAEMDYAGVDCCVLQNHPIYGRLNDFFADCVAQYPDRFIALANVHEGRAHTDEELAELDRCIKTLKMKGIFYQVGEFWENGYKDNVDDEKYEIFWDTVEKAGLVLFWDPAPVAFPSAEAYTDQMERMYKVLERHPGIPTVLVQAFPLGYYAQDGKYKLPDVAHRLAKLPKFLIEIAYPISYGGIWEYPYAEARPLIRQLRDWFGAERLVWGSDMPNVIRFCTYRHSYQFFKHCDFLSESEMDLLLGDNLANLFGITKA
ncbi:MAG: amidohydrolase [Firmicutes bacterium]|nr:amidohydrolase [Candidatus Fermentithermobacillaceae bacterium]